MLTLLAPAATILVGLLTLAGVIATLRQRAGAEAKERYWKRLLWALETSTSRDPENRAAAVAALHILHRDPLATDEDKRLINAVIAAKTTE